ncbi:MAG: SDR family oxidoreductase [Tepidisphaeraceae bacterium]
MLVNNASLFIADDTPLGPSPALQRRLFEVNAFAPTTITAALHPALRTAGGCVINFIDLLAERPWPTYSAYCASKAALRITTMAQVRLTAPHIRVNGIAPGVIDWPEAMPMADRSAYLKKVPLGRAGTPKDAANLVLTIAEHLPYVTGDVIRLDGGRSLV